MAVNETSPIVVCDAGPLIHLDEMACLDLLHDFAEVLVPESVWQEVLRHRPQLSSAMPEWITGHVPVPVQSDPELEAIASMFTLHQGERDALWLLRSRHARWLLTDDTAARLASHAMNTEAHGTIGIIVRAMRHDLRSRAEVISVLEAIPEKSTLFIRKQLLEDILQQIRETD
jgi:predicted nucleic acid-binding protein